ncbi:hypothetical protein SAMN05660199_04139 [Klenkia soli]|uniref:Lipoprotein n=1 Tax=Klenkia soli TaxID=1052260 RepID=A0A1H0TF47_9ACTN|nr:hypothetical protein [Klenkia soli]SDP52647.1 hypothetical protein SAMN05660199_04139 [Klenkia soli]
MSHRRRTGALLAVASSALLLAGCGGSDDADGAPASPPAASSSAVGSSGSSGTATADYDTIAVPDEFGGGTIPVPPGLTPGEPTVQDGKWKVEIDGIDKEQGIDFYREALPALGYTTDVENELLYTASDGTRTVTATLSAGPDGVDVFVEPAS